MALTYVDISSTPNYTALSTDIVDDKITGASIISGTVFLTDTGNWKIIKPDLTLADYVLPGIRPASRDCTLNSTTTPLDADEVFTGTGADVLNYSAMTIMAYSDVASADDGLVVQFSPNGEDWHDGECYNVLAGATKFFTPPVQGRYMRVVYTNGSEDQTEFHLHTVMKAFPIKWSSHNVADPISVDDDAELTKSVITAQGDDQVFRNVPSDNAGLLRVNTFPYTYAISEGDIEGHTSLLKFGTRTNGSTNESTVWEGNTDLYVYMSSAQQLKVVSSSTEDIATTGTGARTLFISGQDANFAEISETIDMDGTDTVTTELSYLRVYRAYVVTCGTANTNVGKIYIRNNAATVEQAVINAGDGQTLMTLWTVPAGKTAYLVGGTFSSDSSKGARVSMFTRTNDGGTTYPFLIKYRAYTFAGNESFTFTIPFKIPEKTDIEVRYKAVSSGSNVGSTFELWYEDND